MNKSKVSELNDYLNMWPLTIVLLTFSHSVAGGASEIKFKESIPMTECKAYGKLATHQTKSESQSFPGGVIEGQQKMEGENEAVEEIYEPIPN